LVTVNEIAFDAPPAGAALTTVTVSVPEAAMSAAGTTADNCVGLTTVVTSGTPLHSTTEPITKLVPVTVNVKPAPPPEAMVVERAVTTGTGSLTVNVDAADVPPPGAGLTTVTESVPPAAISAAGTVAVICVALTTVVTRGTPFQSTTVPVTKPLPVTVSVKPAVPAIADVCDDPVNTGTALLTVNVAAEDAPPPGVALKSVTESVPAVARSASGTVAVTSVELTNAVASATPFHCTTERLSRLVPITVSVNAALPVVAVFCESEVSVGTGLSIVKVTAGVDGPPPGKGLNTVIETVPAVVMSAAGTDAVTSVVLTTVVTRAAPFHSTTVPVSKLVPVTVRVKAALPAIAEVCDNVPTVGTGLLIVKVIAADTPPPGSGLATVTGTVPEFAMSAAGTVAVNEVALLNVVAISVPFQSTPELATKFVPVRVSVKAAVPPIAEVCESDVSVGTGLLIVNVIAADVPPPGKALTTVTEAVPASAMSPAGTVAVTSVGLT
jgi:hypothetical protein